MFLPGESNVPLLLAAQFWRFVFLQREVAQYAQTFIEFPPMQRGASFNLEAVKAEIEERMRAMKAKTE